MNINEYFKELETKIKVVYSVAEEARKKGLDPKSKVEVPLAKTLVERVVRLISTLYPQLDSPQLVNRMLELEKEYGNLDPAVCLKIAEEIAKEKFCKFQNLEEGIDAGIRVAFGYLTLGVVAAPLEGYTHFKLKKTGDGKDYFSAYFSGPIGGAGRTAASISLLIIDYLRETFGYARYDPVEKEVKRCVTELYDFHERITNLQYLPTEKETEFLVSHLPIQLGGDPSHDKEVSNYRDLERVETNFIRSGFCLILGEGIAQKAPKALKVLKKLRQQGFKLSDWDWLEEFCELQKKLRDVKKDEKAAAVYIQDLVAGRPVYGHPSRSGTFRLRYGRARNTGYSCLAIHPATMRATNNFIAIGTQLKTERPTKGGVMASCDSIDGPIVKLKNRSVKKLKIPEEVKYEEIKEIIYLGDMLVPYGDFANRNSQLFPAGYVEQIWFQELKKKVEEKNAIIDLNNIYDLSFNTAIDLSKTFDVPLHPSFIFYWSQLNKREFLALLDWLQAGRISKKLILPWNKSEQERFQNGKRALELLGVEHEVITENVILKEDESKAFLTNLGINYQLVNKENYFIDEEIREIGKIIKGQETEKVLELINLISKFKIKDKAGSFIGSRMGRPEKAKLRKLIGSPNVLFPVGYEGGRLRSVNEAVEVGNIKADFPIYFCKKCGKETIYFICEECGEECSLLNYCPECQQRFPGQKCPEHGKGQSYISKRVDSKYYFNNAVKKLRLEPEEIPVLVKGVRGTSNKNHVPENLAKGLLRSLFGLSVNKDGTIRFDATEMPLTHFKPIEIGTAVEKLKELGYSKDVFGKELHDENQILEIKPHDIILPACPDSKDEKADDVFMNVANFIDSLLIRFYDLRSFYNIRRREDLIGHLMACIAPHNCACVAARIIGFSKTQGLLASPYIHAACRRDCDGDEIAVMLLMDLLLNFSREFLPAHRGGTQDAPLVLNARIRAGEVDDMIFDVDVVEELPLALYEAAERFASPYEVKIERIKDRLGGNREFSELNYEYEVSNINSGALCSSYKLLGTMQEKVQKQMELVEKLRGVDTGDVARLIIDRHFMRDIRGNLRKFSQQQFRCTSCNEKYRRPPLSGICKCGGNIIFTISEGSIIKYLQPALSLAEKYDVPEYVRQALNLTKSYVESIFGREKEKQENVSKWF